MLHLDLNTRLRIPMTKLYIRLDFEPSGSSLSPAMIELLEAIKDEGSLRRTALAVSMSYRKAWLLLQQMQKTFAGPVALAGSGGDGGGSTQLTEVGLAILKHYHSIESNALAAAQKELRAIEAIVRHDAPPRRKERT